MRGSATPVLRLGTRSSPLALWQAAWVRDQLSSRTAVEFVSMTTTGDRTSGSLADHGGKALFVKELDQALLQGEIDAAVHSLKDVPGKLPDGIVMAACSVRADPRDLFISMGESLGALPSGGVIGTISPRRKWQLMRLYPQLRVTPLRGNVGSRLSRLEDKKVDGILLAAAGISRLKLNPPYAQPLDPEVMIPAVGQGTLAVLARSDDTPTIKLLHETCHDEANGTVTTCERALLEAIGGDCDTPLAGYAQWQSAHTIRLKAFLSAPDGSKHVRLVKDGKASEVKDLGVRMADELQGELAKL